MNRDVKHHAFCDCPTCLGEWARWMEQRRAETQFDGLCTMDPDRQGARAPTDREWRERLDEIAPRVRE